MMPKDPRNKFAVEEVTNSMVVPRNEQDRVGRLLSAQHNDFVASYLATLINPKSHMSRVPDSYARPTALVRSISTYDIPVFIDGTVDSGRFSAAIQPTMGGISAPINFKVGLVKGNTTWPTDFSNSGNYTTTLNGRDVRLDQFYGQLTQPYTGSCGADAVSISPNPPFGAAGAFALGFGYNLSPVYSVAGNYSRFTLSPGLYYLEVFMNATGTLVQSINFSSEINLVNEFNFTTPTTVNLSWYLVVNSNGQYFEINNVGSAGNVQTQMFLTRAVNDSLDAPQDYGDMKEYRPVGMSVLATYVGPTLTDGGNIAVAYVPGNTLATQFYSSGSVSQGLLQNWENLSLLPGSYNGKLKEGAYAWWAPESNVDVEMNYPSSWEARAPPAIIVSGAYAPGTFSGTGYSQTIVRLEVVTVYEFTTNSQLYEVSKYIGSQHIFDTVNKIASAEPHCMANAQHNSFIGRVLKGVGNAAKWVWNNRDAIGRVGQAAMPLLL